MDVISSIAKPTRDFEYFEYHLDQMENDPLGHFDSKKEANKHIKKFRKEAEKISELESEYLTKFHSEEYPSIRKEADWIAEYYFWKGYVNTAKAIWRNLNMLELIFDISKDFKGDFQFHTPIGILFTKDEQVLEFINECTYQMEEEPKYNVIFDINNDQKVDFTLLPLYVNHFMDQFHESIIADYKNANSGKPNSDL
jgi:hypothetical protein